MTNRARQASAAALAAAGFAAVLVGCAEPRWDRDLDPAATAACKDRVSQEMGVDVENVTLFVGEASAGGETASLAGRAIAGGVDVQFLCYVVNDDGEWRVADISVA